MENAQILKLKRIFINEFQKKKKLKKYDKGINVNKTNLRKFELFIEQFLKNIEVSLFIFLRIFNID